MAPVSRVAPPSLSGSPSPEEVALTLRNRPLAEKIGFAVGLGFVAYAIRVRSRPVADKRFRRIEEKVVEPDEELPA